MEVDLYPRHHPERADVIDGAIGELSAFHETFGYSCCRRGAACGAGSGDATSRLRWSPRLNYAQGVGPETAVLPSGWELRLIPVRNDNTRGVTGWCLEPHDLVLSKLIAGRENDQQYAAEAVRHHLVKVRVLEERLAETELADELRAAVSARLVGLGTS